MIKINILAQNRADACSFYRSWGPWSEFRKMNPDLNIQLIEENRITWSSVIDCDLLFLQRPFLESHVTALQIARDMDVPTWIDWDDLLWAVGRDNPCFEMYGEKVRNHMMAAARMADAITVTTLALADALPEECKGKTWVIQNDLPIRLKHSDPPYQDGGGRVRIVWRGSETHEGDWLALQGAVDAVAGMDVEWLLIGRPPFWVTQMLAAKFPGKVSVAGTVPIGQYFHWMTSGGPRGHVLFIPLADTEFNRAKSHCAALEGVFGGMLPVAPDWEQWKTGTTGDLFLYKDAKDAGYRLKVAVQTVQDGRHVDVVRKMATQHRTTDCAGHEVRRYILEVLGAQQCQMQSAKCKKAV